MHLHDKWRAAYTSHRCNVANEIEIEILIKRGIDMVIRANQKERVAVGWRAHDRFGTHIAACAGPVFNNELLSQTFRQRLTDDTRDDVDRAAGWISDNDANWA
jgi:hypothetical protein